MDVYDKDRRKTGETICRGQPLNEGQRVLTVVVMVVDNENRVLNTKRSQEKSAFPGWWESSGGGVICGETTRQAGVRELKEETGLQVEPQELIFLSTCTTDDCFRDIYIVRIDSPLEKITFQPGETVDAKMIPCEEWEKLAIARDNFYLTPTIPGDLEFYRILRDFLKL